MKEIYDIRQQIPQPPAMYTKPYDPLDHPYPKMLHDPETGKPYLDHQRKYVIVKDAEEEITFLASKGIKAVTFKNRNDKVDVKIVTGAPAETIAHKVEVTVEETATEVVDAVENVFKRGPGRPPKSSLPADLK